MGGHYAGPWVIALVLLSGCTGAIHREFNLDSNPPPSLSVDARQRLVIVTDHGGPKQNRHVVCAEPSPDALVAIAAAASGKAAVGEKSLGVSGQLAESAAALGPRTQTIQLLRDGLYRACEAYMNGALDEYEYRRIVFGYDETMLTLLAIDGLTQRTYVLPPKLSAPTEAGKDGENAPASSPQVAGQPLATSAAVSESTAQVIRDILKDYYQFQMQLKELYMHKPSQ